MIDGLESPKPSEDKDTPPKCSKMKKVKDGAKRNSESLGVSLSVVLVWFVTDVMEYDIPMEVLGAILTSLGIVAARIRDDLL